MKERFISTVPISIRKAYRTPRSARRIRHKSREGIIRAQTMVRARYAVCNMQETGI